MNPHQTTFSGYSRKSEHKVGELIRYIHNGNIYKGQIMQVHYEGDSYTVCDPTNEAEMILWNAGYAVGAFIKNNQLL